MKLMFPLKPIPDRRLLVNNTPPPPDRFGPEDNRGTPFT